MARKVRGKDLFGRWFAVEGDIGFQYGDHVEIDGAAEHLPVDVEFDVVEEDGRLLFDRLVLKRRPGVPIDSTVMRELPLPALLLRSSVFGLARRTDYKGGTDFEGIDLDGLDDDDRAVLTYKLAYAIGQPPTAAVAAHFGISAAAAAKRIERLRKSGRLNQTEPGRKGI